MILAMVLVVIGVCIAMGIALRLAYLETEADLPPRRHLPRQTPAGL